MPGDRLQRRIELLLDEADHGVAVRDWPLVRDRCIRVLELDPVNAEAREYLAVAQRATEGAASAPSTTGEAPATSPPARRAHAPVPSPLPAHGVPASATPEPDPSAAPAHVATGVPPSPLPAAPYIFVSYSSRDRDDALALVEALEQAGLRVWIDRAALSGGATWTAEIV